MTVPQPSELRFGVVPVVGRGIAVLNGVSVVQGKGEVLGRFVCENLTTFPFAKRILGKLIRGLFGIFIFKIKVGAYEKLAKKVTIYNCSTKTQTHAPVLLLPMVR